MTSPPTLPRQVRGPNVDAALAAFEEAGGVLDSADVRALVGLLGEHAPALLPLALGDTDLPADVLAMGDLDRRLRVRPLVRAFGAIAAGGDEPRTRRRMRRLRHRHAVRLALQEILRLADVDETSAQMSALAAAVTDAALDAAQRTVADRHGPVHDGSGEPITLTCLGMGKLGGWELNLGSDIDLCFFYGSDEGEAGELTVHEYMGRVVSRATKIIADVTEDGFCFRVDLRLRPEGSRGPLVNSLASAERYYESWGRTWERAALLRARPIAGDRALGAQLLEALRPFIYRRTVDPSVASQMEEMLRRTRRELKVDEERDIKLGRGGIREAEFFVQSLQLIWGGRFPSLRVPGTIPALRRLEAAGLVRESERYALSSAWARLRVIEHRVHVVTGYQTHLLPAPGEGRERFARSLGYPDTEAFELALARDREMVAELFDSLGPERGPRAERPSERGDRYAGLADLAASGADVETVASALAEHFDLVDPAEAAEHVLRLARRADAPLGPVTRRGYPQLGPRLFAEVADVADPDSALEHLADFFGRLHGLSYDRLVLAEPVHLRRLVALFGASRTLARALVGHPEHLDLLLAREVIDEREVRALHASFEVTDTGADADAWVEGMRSAKRIATMRAGLALSTAELTLDETTRVLSLAADLQIQAALTLATQEASARFGAAGVATATGERAAMVVVALGKLGGHELGFGGDLDLVFLYDEDGETEGRPGRDGVTHAEYFTRIAQRTMRILSQPAASGPGYGADVRLRPGGAQGTLVVSLAAFDRYHAERAAPWERQALIRARAVAGPPALRTQVEERVAAHAHGGMRQSAEELAAMRARIELELAGETASRFHPKLGYGGLVDVEFLSQWLCMAKPPQDAARLRGSTVAALAELAAMGELAQNDADTLASHYEFLRAIEQTLRLLEETQEPLLQVGTRRLALVARRLVRERDGHDPARVLCATYTRRASEVREIFERVAAPVHTRGAPWESA